MFAFGFEPGIQLRLLLIPKPDHIQRVAIRDAFVSFQVTAVQRVQQVIQVIGVRAVIVGLKIQFQNVWLAMLLNGSLKKPGQFLNLQQAAINPECPVTAH